MLDLNTLRNRAYQNACDHGFHDRELSDNHCFMLVITELSEAVEADRKGRRADKAEFELVVSSNSDHMSEAFVKGWSKIRLRMNWPIRLFVCLIWPVFGVLI